MIKFDEELKMKAQVLPLKVKAVLYI